MSELKFKVPNLVNGEECYSSSQIGIVSPHNLEIIGSLSIASGQEVSAAIESAFNTQLEWQAIPPVKRGELLHKICSMIEEHAEEIANAIALESGKSLSMSHGELGAAIQCGRFFAGEGQRLFGRTLTSGVEGKFNATVRIPCGVTGLITAANTPAPNFAWKVFPALICGNGIVLKPAEDTPISAYMLGKICIDAGLPKGLMNIVNGYGADVGPLIVNDHRVSLISFTGSTKVGKRISSQCADQMKKVSLELGGKNAMIICTDADIENALNWAVSSCFSNAGQRCAATSRLIVLAEIYDLFKEKFVKLARELKLGIDEDSDLGPVINEKQYKNIRSSIDKCISEGGTLLCGEEEIDETGYYIRPTIIENVSDNNDIFGNELFGPVVTLHKVKNLEEAIDLANTSKYGLTASVHTQNLNNAFYFVEKIKSGVANVNMGTHGSEPHLPFGGVNESGNGTREPGTEALDVYCELKNVSFLTNEI